MQHLKISPKGLECAYGSKDSMDLGVKERKAITKNTKASSIALALFIGEIRKIYSIALIAI